MLPNCDKSEAEPRHVVQEAHSFAPQRRLCLLGLRFRVYGLGFKGLGVQGFGFLRIQGLGLGVQGLGFRGCRVQGFRQWFRAAGLELGFGGLRVQGLLGYREWLRAWGLEWGLLVNIDAQRRHTIHKRLQSLVHVHYFSGPCDLSMGAYVRHADV